MNFNYVEHYKTDAEKFDYFEERKGATEHDERRVHEYIESKMNPDIKTILDVGCGSAWVAKRFLTKNKNVISFDISEINVKKARNFYPAKNHYGLVGDSFFLPLKTNSVDCVIASEIIEHVVNPKAFARELFRVVKPGGELIITTPYKEILRYSLCIHCNQKTPVNAHIHSFDEKILSGFFNNSETSKKVWYIFGNKVLIFLRTYVVLKFLPFGLWKAADKIANLLINKPAHILIKYCK